MNLMQLLANIFCILRHDRLLQVTEAHLDELVAVAVEQVEQLANIFAD